MTRPDGRPLKAMLATHVNVYVNVPAVHGYGLRLRYPSLFTAVTFTFLHWRCLLADRAYIRRHAIAFLCHPPCRKHGRNMIGLCATL